MATINISPYYVLNIKNSQVFVVAAVKFSQVQNMH